MYVAIIRNPNGYKKLADRQQAASGRSATLEDVVELRVHKRDAVLSEHRTRSVKHLEVEALRIDLQDVDRLDRCVRAELLHGPDLHWQARTHLAEANCVRSVLEHAVELRESVRVQLALSPRVTKSETEGLDIEPLDLSAQPIVGLRMGLEREDARVGEPGADRDRGLTHVRADVEEDAGRAAQRLGEALNVEPHVLPERLGRDPSHVQTGSQSGRSNAAFRSGEDRHAYLGYAQRSSSPPTRARRPSR